MKQFILLIIILIIYMSCKNCNEHTENEQIKQSEILFVKSFVRIDGQYPYYSRLIFKNNNTFKYKYISVLFEGFSVGTWNIDSPFIVLNSALLDTCLYYSKFGEECIPVTDFGEVDKILNATTKNGCLPTDKFTRYVSFKNDSFYLSNDTLFYFAIKEDIYCPIKHIYKIER